jgi:hypothetical protein
MRKVVGMKLKQTLMSQQNAMDQIFQMIQHANMFVENFQDYCVNLRIKLSKFYDERFFPSI